MGNCWKLLDVWETNSPFYPAAEISAASRGFLNCISELHHVSMRFPRNSQTQRDPRVEHNSPNPPELVVSIPNKSQSRGSFCAHWIWGEMSGQGGAGPAKWWFLSELGSVCTYYRYSSSLPCFQLGGWSSWWFSCMLKSLAVRGQAVGFIYQLEAPAGNSCISHSAVLGRIPQIYSF